ncbi:hypothetical protein HanPSC8_Chr10g0416411 [Helianthus annuus]|nr:hypothetical protein HanPSC8_Chr10g0416411 [Helianthus annuus]
MDESHDDQNFRCKIKKIWNKTCVFCCKKYPIPTSIVILFFLLYLFFPFVFKLLIYSVPLVGFPLLVQRVLSGNNDRQKINKQVEDDRRKRLAKSRRSFKSVYSDRSRLIRQNTLKKSDDTNADDNDNIFLKSLHDLLSEKKSNDIFNFESFVGKGESSSSNDKVKNFHPQVVDKDRLEDDDKPKDHNKVVRWTEDDQKNERDLDLAEAERNKRLQSLMVRRRSRKNLGFEESGSSGNVEIPAVKTTKINPFLEDKSDGKKSPGSAPSSMIKTSNPFDIPYDPHEEKLDLTGDNFHEEFTLVQPKEPVFSRHQSFSLGALSRSVIAHDKHEIPYYKDLSDKQKSAIGFVTSTLDNEDDNKRMQQDSPISDDSIVSNHPKEEGTEIKPQETDSYDERKADINFFYGNNKKSHHAVSYSMVSDMQVELSDEDSVPTIDDLDVEKDRKSLLNSSNPQTDSETNEVQQSDNVLHQTNNDSGEQAFRDRDVNNLQDQSVRQL